MKPGIHRLSHEKYHKDPCEQPSLSRSVILDLVTKTPAHARYNHPRLNPILIQDEDSKFDIGTAAHALFLEGLDNCAVIDAKDWRTKAAQEARDFARADGFVPLLADQYERVKAMVVEANRQLAASELGIKALRQEGDSELSYIWQDKAEKSEDMVWCRIRPDWISHKKIADGGKRKIILDYKTSESADPNAFLRKAFALGYDIQDSLYRRGVQAVEGGEAPRFVFMLQETTAPFMCSFVALDPVAQDIGRQKVDMGLFLWAKCLKENNWPAYPAQVCHIETPPYAMAAWEERATGLGV